MIAKQQNCDWCGRSCGFFIHSRQLDGPLSCGRQECAKNEEEDDKDEDDLLPGWANRGIRSSAKAAPRERSN